jgi:hypothetical protein
MSRALTSSAPVSMALALKTACVSGPDTQEDDNA